MQFLFIREFTALVKSQRKTSVTLMSRQSCKALWVPWDALRDPRTAALKPDPARRMPSSFPRQRSDELLTDLPAFQVPRTLKML